MITCPLCNRTHDLPICQEIVIPAEDFDEILEMIENPPPPSPAMIAMFRDYMEMVVTGRLVTDATSREEAREWLTNRGFACPDV